MAYGIIKQTGGYIFVDSVVGVGSTFTIYCPAYDLPAAELNKPRLTLVPTAPPPAPAPPDHPPAVVLLVEDEAPVRAFAARALRLRGYNVIEASCAEEALEVLQDDRLVVDLFLTDVIMPGLDGPTWVRRALQDRPGVKVVFVSGYAEEQMEDGSLTIPNSVFLPKPFSLADLTETVQRQLL